MKCPKCGAADGVMNLDELNEFFGRVNDSDWQWICGSCDHLFTDKEAKDSAWYKDVDFGEMTISELADVIYADWGHAISFSARPYLEAMTSLKNEDDMYGNESGREILQYFLINARQWRGETARAVKKEIKDRLKCQNTLFSHLRGM